MQNDFEPPTFEGSITGRKAELSTLETYLLRDRRASISHGLVPTGVDGGVGVASLAASYIGSHFKSFEQVFWIDAATNKSLRSSFAKLAGRFSLPRKPESIRQGSAIVNKWFSAHTDSLVIFANADSPELLREYLPQPQGSRLPAMLTLWSTPLKIENLVLLDPLTVAESIDVLKTYSGAEELRTKDRTAAGKITSGLGGLPLSLRIVGRFAQQQFNGSLAEAAAFFLLNDSTTVSAPCRMGLALIVRQLLEHLRNHDVEGFRVLGLLSAFGNAWVPLALLAGDRGLHGAPLLLNTATTFIELGILRSRRDGRVRLHPSLGNVIRSYLDSDSVNRFAIRALRNTHALLLDKKAYPSEMPDPDIFTHATRCIEHLPLSPDAEQLSGTLRWLASANSSLEMYSVAEQCLRKAKEVVGAHFGQSSQKAGEVLDELAGVLESRGDYGHAKEFYIDALAIRKQLFGEGSSEWIHSLNDYAFTLEREARYVLDVSGAKSQFAAAADSFEAVLAARTRTGAAASDEDIGIALNNLARTSIFTSDFTTARTCLRKAREICERRLPRGNDLAIHVYNNIGLLQLKRRKFRGAERWLKKSYAKGVEYFGTTEHSNLAFTLSNLARAYLGQKRFRKARKAAEEAMALVFRILGKSHPRYSDSLRLLAEVYRIETNKESGIEAFASASRAGWLAQELHSCVHRQDSALAFEWIGRASRRMIRAIRKLANEAPTDGVSRNVLRAILAQDIAPGGPDSETVPDWNPIFLSHEMRDQWTVEKRHASVSSNSIEWAIQVLRLKAAELPPELQQATLALTDEVLAARQAIDTSVASDSLRQTASSSKNLSSSKSKASLDPARQIRRVIQYSEIFREEPLNQLNNVLTKVSGTDPGHDAKRRFVTELQAAASALGLVYYFQGHEVKQLSFTSGSVGQGQVQLRFSTAFDGKKSHSPVEIPLLQAALRKS